MSKSGLNPLLKEFRAGDVELAKQLLSLRQQPGAALQHRVQTIPRQKAHPMPTLSRLLWASTALVIVVLLLTSPIAKSKLGFEQVIGRIQVMVMDVWPRHTEPIVIESSPMSLQEARATVPFDFAIPTYLPASLITDEEVFVTKLEIPIVKIRWRDSEGGFVQLAARPYSVENNLTQTVIGPESSQTILINGQKAVVVYGGWDQSSRTWSHQALVVTLIWEVNDIQYKLLSFSRAVPLTELADIAQSVR